MDLTWIIWIEKLLIVLVQTAQSAMIVVKCSNLLVTTDKFKILVTYRNLAWTGKKIQQKSTSFALADE